MVPDIAAELRGARNMTVLDVGTLSVAIESDDDSATAPAVRGVDLIADAAETMHWLDHLILQIVPTGLWSSRRPRARWVHLNLVGGRNIHVHWDWFCSEQATSEGLVVCGYLLTHAIPDRYLLALPSRPSARQLRMEFEGDDLEDDRTRRSLFRSVPVLAAAFTDVTFTFNHPTSPLPTPLFEWMKALARVSECIHQMDYVENPRMTYEVSMQNLSDVSHVTRMAALIVCCIEPVARWDRTRCIVRIPDAIVAPLENALRAAVLCDPDRAALFTLLDQKIVSVESLNRRL